MSDIAMRDITLTVNGRTRTGRPSPRTHLADFLREDLLLTGTHLGCEHGVCGACTVLLDGEPVRACITFAALCGDRDVCSIEGLDDDPVAQALRAAFTAEHALQCGYCTPGMLVSARDIVLRLPDADDDRVRLELSGNLCRCTGYNGIVRAIRRVLESRAGAAAPSRPKLGQTRFAARREAVPNPATTPATTPVAVAARPTGVSRPNHLVQAVALDLPAALVWTAVQDPGLVAGCVPGAHLLSVENGRIAGEMLVALGPIQARFSGEVTLAYAPDDRSGRIDGQGRDQASGTSLSAQATFQVVEAGADACRVELVMDYTLRGPLAQFGRGPIVQVFAAEIAETVGRNLRARLRGEAPPAAAARLGAGGLMLRVIWRAVRGLLFRSHA